jgi:exopolysaccharide biosynthesis polyprenyl glycosylphosphotransferase
MGSFIGILFLIGAEYVLNRAVFPARLVTVYGFLFAFLLTLLFRTIARGIRRFLFTQNIGIANVLIVGTTDITAELAQQLANPKLGYKVVGIIGDRRSSYPNIYPSIQFKNFEEAAHHLKTTDVNTIVQTELFAGSDQNDEILAYAQEHHIAYRFVPGNSNLFVGSIEVNLFEGIPTVAVHQTALTGWGRILKRIFDLIFGIFIVIIASPILISVWLILATVGGGKPIYKQTRMSRFNSKIGLYKFRTHSHVYNGLTPEEAFAKMGKPELAKKYRENGDYIENDPRISIIGRFLRKTSIDELPQLFNVIKGDLSLVGPRPLIPQEINMAENKHVILSVKPGVTGLAVISGRKNIPFEERRKLDMYYAQNWSFWMDLVIIAKTAVQVVARAFSGKAD